MDLIDLPFIFFIILALVIFVLLGITISKRGKNTLWISYGIALVLYIMVFAFKYKAYDESIIAGVAVATLVVLGITAVLQMGEPDNTSEETNTLSKYDITIFILTTICFVLSILMYFKSDIQKFSSL
jgi:hypothetical protein